jgi:hypothetical protein
MFGPNSFVHNLSAIYLMLHLAHVIPFVIYLLVSNKVLYLSLYQKKKDISTYSLSLSHFMEKVIDFQFL